MGNIGATEIILILSVILVFFGAKKIPEIAKGFGKGIKEFKKEIETINDDIKPLKKESQK
ncbi:MAG TPA: twin-arginine translocase TatA/TatE family subunit [Ignavibacteria bacterium]|nr:twin-arginine translocase TatA/TatE family subunit [Ignavibacteria bacterium]